MFRCSNFALSHIRSKTTFIFRSFQRSSHRENDSNRVGVKSENLVGKLLHRKQRQWLHTLGSLIRAAETKMRNRLRGILHQSCCCCCQKEDLQTRTRQRWSFYSLYDSFIFFGWWSSVEVVCSTNAPYFSDSFLFPFEVLFAISFLKQECIS